jgi:hypothetical protein
MSAVTNIFDPVLYSIQENEFIRANAGLPTAVAIRNIGPGVNPKAVIPALSRLYELTELEKHSGLVWCGLEPVKAAISAYLEQAERWSMDRRRGKPRFPTMATYDSRGRAHMQGPGSDSQFVKTYFDQHGNRIPFAIELIADGQDEWTPDWTVSDDPKAGSGITVNHELNRIECFCGEVFKYKSESRGSYNAARGRLSKHLRSATEELDRHREIHTNEFGG